MTEEDYHHFYDICDQIQALKKERDELVPSFQKHMAEDGGTLLEMVLKERYNK